MHRKERMMGGCMNATNFPTQNNFPEIIGEHIHDYIPIPVTSSTREPKGYKAVFREKGN